MVEVKIVTYRDIFQYEAQRKGRYSEEYKKLSAQIMLDKEDLEKLGIKDGSRVLVKNGIGRVVVTARLSDEESHPYPHPGLAFMIDSPWSNQLLGDPVDETGIPELKDISAQVDPTEEQVTGMKELLERIRA
jgi:formylmethanofuran dehydrogenase subunit D